MNTWNNQAGVQPQYNPYMSRLPIYTANPIHGENAAWQFPMAPNSEIYLPDAEENIIWWIRTDTNGNKTIEPFDISPHKKPEPIDLNSLIERINNLEKKVNAKSNKPNAKPTIDASIE